MAIKLIQLTAPVAAEKTMARLARDHGPAIFQKISDLGEDHGLYQFACGSKERQALMDALYEVVKTSEKGRLYLIPVEATVPEMEAGHVRDTREELSAKLGVGAELNRSYLLFVFLSTIVALIGLLQNNVAVVVGAMVIAPLLGPNLGLAFGTALGWWGLIRRSLTTGLTGLALAVGLSAALGALWTGPIDSPELLSRTEVGIGGVILATASGIAGVLSVTTGLSMTLVGVMVAVALLPPTATMGFMLGAGQFHMAFGAALLLAVNVTCVNLSGLLVFLLKGFGPREDFRKRIATGTITIGFAIWTTLLILILIRFL